MKNYWIVFEVNGTDTTGITERGPEWYWDCETFDTLWDAEQALKGLVADPELYRNISPILMPVSP